MKTILLIDDDPVVRSLASGILRKNGYNVHVAKDGSEGIDLTKKYHPDLVVTDYQMPGISGMEVLASLRDYNEMLPVIMLTAHGDATLTIKSMQTGAFDFIEKPINPKELLETIKNGLLTSEGAQQKSGQTVSEKKKVDDNIMVGKSPAMLQIFKNIGRISQNNVNVMITGDPGTGKARLAKLIHQSSSSADNPLVFISCKALSDEELKHAFSEGVKNGTIVLDELGALSTELQLRLLDLMESHALAQKPGKKSNYRIISVARADMNQLVEEGSFLKELFYQLKVFLFHIPALSERKEDIPHLVKQLLTEMNVELGKNVSQVEEGVIPLLQSYDWPGNVRELRNVLLQAMVLSHGDLLQKKHISLEGEATIEPELFEADDFELRSLADVEKEHIGMVLRKVRWSKQEAAAVLGITRPTLNAKIDKYGLTRG